MDLQIRQIEKKDYADLISMFIEFASFQKMPDKMINSVEQIINESDNLNEFVIETSIGELVGYTTYFYTYFT